MRFIGKVPVIHRKVNGERRCTCGAELTFSCDDWIHPEVLEMTDDHLTKTNQEVWIVSIATRSDECPYRDDFSDRCHHTGNKSGVCNKEDCKVKAVFS